MSAAVRGIWGAAVVAACAAPSAAANVWPRVSQMWAEGAASGTEVGLTLALAMSAVGMAAVPFAMKKAGNLGFWLVCLVMGLGLASFNYTMAVELAGKWRDASTAPAALTAAKAAGLKSRIASATRSRNELPPFVWTDADGVTAAKRAADAAATTREEECNRRGKAATLCRDREKDLGAALAALTAATSNRAATARAEKLDAELAKAQQELMALGPIPDVVDPAAARIGKAISKFVDLGDRPDLVVIDWWPTFVAVMIEAIGLLMPRIILTATGHVGGTPEPARTWRLGTWHRRRHVEGDVSEKPRSVATSPATQVAAAVARGAASAARPKKPSKSAPAAVGDADTVRQWHAARTIARPGSKLKPLETYQKSYVPFCEERGLDPVSFTRFGLVVKAPPAEGGCGFGFERNKSKRDYYLDVALIAAPKLVAPGVGGRRAGLDTGLPSRAT